MAKRSIGWLVTCALAMLAPTIAAQTPPRPEDIVVSGHHDEPLSDWRRSESDHIIVSCRCSADELSRTATNLELLYRLMTRLYRANAQTDDAVKLRVILLDNQARLRTLIAGDTRADEGPWAPAFASQRYYDPSAGGDLLVVARADQMVDLNTSRRLEQDCEDASHEGGSETGNPVCGIAIPHLDPISRPWRGLLYSAFAQHFLLTYAPAAYPRWYLDGIGALFSTLDVRGDQALDYAEPPESYKQALRSYGVPDVAKILSGSYLGDPKDDARWSPYGAWLLAHYFVYSPLRPEIRQQFERYMAAIRQGRPMAEAVTAFTDLKKLQRDVTAYGMERSLSFARTAPRPAKIVEPLITQLNAARAAVIEDRVALDAHLAATPAGTAAEPAWLQALRTRIAALPYEADAYALLAEAQCRAGRAGDCLATANRMLQQTPDAVEALAWKGAALTGLALTGSTADRPAALASARSVLEQAMMRDAQSPLARIAYFESFTRAGEAPPPPALRAMVDAIRAVPAAPDPRLALGTELVREGESDAARRVLLPVLYSPYAGPEQGMAERLLAPHAP